MSRKGFRSGQLVWVSARVDEWCRARFQTSRGYPEERSLTAGTPCTVIRRALAKDFGTWARHTHRGKSTGRRLSETAWLVLYEGRPAMIDEEFLVLRRYRSRGSKEL